MSNERNLYMIVIKFFSQRNKIIIKDLCFAHDINVPTKKK